MKIDPRLHELLLMMVVQFAQSMILAFNLRAIAHAEYTWIMLVAPLSTISTYFIVRHMSAAKNHWGLAGQVIGGTAATLLAVWLTATWD